MLGSSEFWLLGVGRLGLPAKGQHPSSSPTGWPWWGGGLSGAFLRGVTAWLWWDWGWQQHGQEHLPTFPAVLQLCGHPICDPAGKTRASWHKHPTGCAALTLAASSYQFPHFTGYTGIALTSHRNKEVPEGSASTAPLLPAALPGERVPGALFAQGSSGQQDPHEPALWPRGQGGQRSPGVC